MSKNIIYRSLGKKKAPLFIIAALLGILLILLSKCSSGEEKASEADILSSLDPARYSKELEERIESLCNKMDGVSYSYAVVTLKGGYTAIYAEDMQSGSSNSKNETVILGSGKSEKALLIGYENPEISGIGIVCSGGDDPYIRSQIISVIASAFGVSTNKIFVAGS